MAALPVGRSLHKGCYYYYYITIVSAYWRWVYYLFWILRNLWNIPMGSKVIYLSKIDRSAKWIHPSLLRNHNHHLAPSTYFHRLYKLRQGQDSSVGIATRYGLDGPGIESRRGEDYPHPSRPALRFTQPPIQWIPGSFPSVKASTPHSHLASMLKKE